MDEKKLLTEEQATTIRFQILFGLGLVVVSMVCFWITSQVWIIDLRFAVFAVGALVAVSWLKDGLIMLADVAITVMKMRGK